MSWEVIAIANSTAIPAIAFGATRANTASDSAMPIRPAKIVP